MVNKQDTTDIELDINKLVKRRDPNFLEKAFGVMMALGILGLFFLFIAAIRSFFKEILNREKLFSSRYHIFCAMKELSLGMGRIYMRCYLFFRKLNFADK